MIHRLIELSLRNRGLVIAIYLGLAAWGYWALLRTPIDAIPDLSENQVIVFTDWTGRSPQEVECRDLRRRGGGLADRATRRTRGARKLGV